MSLLRARLDALRGWIEARSSRERWILLLGSGVAVYAFVALTLLNPVLIKRRDLAYDMGQLEQDLQKLQQRAAGAAVEAARSPRAHYDGRRTQLEKELRRLQVELDARNAGLVTPEQARHLLEELLEAEEDLDLVSLTTLEPRPIIDEPSDPVDEGGEADPSEEPVLYRHDIRVELEGDYFATLHYLRALEERASGLVLDELGYEVQSHPRARVTLTVYTLSFERAWIGV